jgi:hypothetical protein
MAKTLSKASNASTTLSSKMQASTALGNANGDQSYRVPSSTGGFIAADPIKFCLRFKPPTLAIVYQLIAKPRKYVHEFKLDLKENADIAKITDELFSKEHIYFNP